MRRRAARLTATEVDGDGAGGDVDDGANAGMRRVTGCDQVGGS